MAQSRISGSSTIKDFGDFLLRNGVKEFHLLQSRGRFTITCVRHGRQVRSSGDDFDLMLRCFIEIIEDNAASEA